MSTGNSAMLIVPGKQGSHNHDFTSKASPSPAPFVKPETSVRPDATRAPGGINLGQRRSSSTHNRSAVISHPVTQNLVEECDVHPVQPRGSLPQTTIFSLISDDPQAEPRHQAPIRSSIDPSTPSSERLNREDTGNMRDLRRKCEVYEATQKFDRELIASQSQEIEELLNKSIRAEEEIKRIESKHIAEVKEVTRRAGDSFVKLTDLHEKFSQTSVGQIKELKQGLDTLRQEIQSSMNAVEPLLAGYNQMRSTLRELSEEHEQQTVLSNDEKIRLQQTNDLLRDQLSDRTGNYTESLERERELQVSLSTLGDSHANVAKALSALHEQHNQMSTKYMDSKFAGSTATRQIGELEETITNLTTDNARMKSLLADNEQAFSKKLQVLAEGEDNMRTR
ncbi:hypothetical protein BN14_06943 [Rhizoctonia solani AG-1 IB]|uniref:Uncharacterized protein n=1 Tax=Thanatephorus cucumeris (strain AG1-IB / isolate 7/3/14) TaxID=1108050 RepID=M5C0F4_THACB|nr:hypothetical protein BN14_06943 [Rhizoctonia solani AG-1 IB]